MSSLELPLQQDLTLSASVHMQILKAEARSHKHTVRRARVTKRKSTKGKSQIFRGHLCPASVTEELLQ